MFTGSSGDFGPLDQAATIRLGASQDDRVYLRRLTIALHGGKLRIAGEQVAVAPAEKVLVKGELGSGKSTLIHPMAGLWPWGSGQILRPKPSGSL